MRMAAHHPCNTLPITAGFRWRWLGLPILPHADTLPLAGIVELNRGSIASSFSTSLPARNVLPFHRPAATRLPPRAYPSPASWGGFHRCLHPSFCSPPLFLPPNSTATRTYAVLAGIRVRIGQPNAIRQVEAFARNASLVTRTALATVPSPPPELVTRPPPSHRGKGHPICTPSHQDVRSTSLLPQEGPPPWPPRSAGGCSHTLQGIIRQGAPT